ncbi:MAG: hypothetical protein H7Y27_15600 [Gemmatimonadaceae bacterium]|nr:hypothetical protein [Chitinophagaceae bacterium]
MNNQIQTYDDLVAERLRLQILFNQQRKQVSDDVQELKEKAKPLLKMVSFVGNITAPNRNNSLIGTGLDLLANGLTSTLLFPKAGWLTKVVAPTVMKKVGSGLLGRIFGRKKNETGNEA